MSASLRLLLTPDRIRAGLPDPGAWRPYPTVTDRAGWDTVPARVRDAIIHEAEELRGIPWPVLPAHLYADFQRNGNRSRFEGPYHDRRRRLASLAIAECLRGDRYHLDDILDGIWAICEEATWCVPAHSSSRRFPGSPLPDPAEPIVDLFAADTASTLAWTAYLLESELVEAAPVVLDHLRCQVRSRVLEPYARDENWRWLWGTSERGPNNWNPWIHSNLLAATLLTELDPERRRSMVIRIVRGLDAFIERYGDDGGCDEGPSYWWRAGGSVFDCLDLLLRASDGALDGFVLPRVREMATFLPRMHIGEDWYVNFADGSARQPTSAELLWAFGVRTGDRVVQRHALSMRGAATSDEDRGDFGRRLRRVFDRAYDAAPAEAPPLLLHSWLPSIEVMTARHRQGDVEGLFLAAKGGHNNESHNHNDVGSFIAALDGEPILIDAGVGVYTRQTFSSERYEIWTMRSSYHTLPVIDGFDQSAGSCFRAQDVQCTLSEASSEISLDLAPAYPAEAGVRRWRRTMRFERAGKGRIVIEDEWELAREPKSLSLNLLTWPEPESVSEEGLRLPTSSRAAVVRWATGTFTTTSEAISTGDDPRLQSVWGERVHRTILRSQRPARSGSWTLTIAPDDSRPEPGL